MNKTAIKNFAIWARVQLIEAAKQRAYEYEITDGGELDTGLNAVAGRLLSKAEKEQRNRLISEIRLKGFEQVMEEVAYTWFNRFIALRYMEVNGFLPSRVRVFSDENGEFKPEILKEAMTVEIDGLDREKVLDYMDRQDNENLFKYLIITQCNALGTGLPGMFEKIENYTELLFPNNLLKSDSVIGKLVTEISEEDWLDAVQIIGWLYQYYNTELKDDTFAKLKKNIKITKERIPAATQLFTPDWIVRYMVENSLGRLWYEGHSSFDKSEWKYYLDEAEQEPEVQTQLSEIRKEYANIKPEGIKVIDPCMGSGHILVYAFDVLMQIYTSAGWSERDAAKSIVENNLFGLDIDDRAGQLAYFAVMMKARKYNRRILNGDTKPNVMAIKDSSFLTDEIIAHVAEKDDEIIADLRVIRTAFKDAKELGSIISVPVHNYQRIIDKIEQMNSVFFENLMSIQDQMQANELLIPLLKQAIIMSQKYDVVVTNPPYMGASGMGAKLADYVKNNFPDSKSDMFAVFIEHCRTMLKKNAFQAMITQHAWMFLSSYENLRHKLLSVDMINMAHLGPRAFEEIGGEVVQTTSFVLRKTHTRQYKGTYCRLIEPTTQQGKEDMFLAKKNRYVTTEDNFTKIPGNPVAYWVSKNLLKTFEKGTMLGKLADSKQGLATADNNRFLRQWFEVNINKTNFSAKNHEEAEASKKKWFPYNKGGEFRKWYGNNDYVVNWENDGFEIKNFFDDKGKLRSRPQNLEFMFKPSASWSLISSGCAAFRYKPIGHLFDIGGMSFFSNKKLLYLLALVNTKYSTEVLKIIAPTINYQCGDIACIPIIEDADKCALIEAIAEENINISKDDWDSFETSWEFKRNPLI